MINASRSHKQAITWLIIGCCFLVMTSDGICQYYTSEKRKGNFGIGYQLSYPFYGFSVIVSPDIGFSFQGMIGMFGKHRSYCGKVRFHLVDEKTIVYAYALIGGLTEETTDYDPGGEEKTSLHTVFGYGIGLGIEYSYAKIPIYMNLEVGYGDINFRGTSREGNAILLGVGLHYFFPVSEI